MLTTCYNYSMINDTLQKLGLSEKEIAIYLAVLQQGKVTPANVAKLTKINRTTVYSVAKELVARGFINEDLAGAYSYLVAVPPSDLNFVIQKEEKALETKKQLIVKAIEELQNVAKNTKYAIPKITFVSEEDLENYLYKRSDEWHRSIMERDGILWGFQDHTFTENYEKWIDWEWKIGGPPGLRLRLLSNKSDVEERMKKKGYEQRQVKYWNKSSQFTATVWVHGDYLIMVVTKKRPHYLVEIHDVTLSHNMRELFKGLWEQTE